MALGAHRLSAVALAVFFRRPSLLRSASGTTSANELCPSSEASAPLFGRSQRSRSPGRRRAKPVIGLQWRSPRANLPRRTQDMPSTPKDQAWGCGCCDPRGSRPRARRGTARHRRHPPTTAAPGGPRQPWKARRLGVPTRMPREVNGRSGHLRHFLVTCSCLQAPS